ncbi:hypothetical protein K458DRAFT_343184 [Lentithecium fluviatile CBS 122367]|uniref:C3H1-type domain-containing protein n=1 Tax=Lentithecium fluviatile CBS 122367 TaxID=1168545 RepID=A0A6G1IU48_9PLEO|nr:hypothetical protein K458DRAFT_343184 [Lentithecium fluviatile CBS 122367]
MASQSFFPAQSSLLGAVGDPVRPAVTAPSSKLTSGTSETISARVERVLQNNNEMTDLLQEMMFRYEYVSQELDRLSKDRDVIANWQTEKLEYIKRERAFNAALMRNPFVAILIDGDGMVFQSEFIREGEKGGRRAAAQLHASIVSYIEQETMNIPPESRIVCRVYANVKGLADVLVRIGMVEDATVMEDFVRGFTRGKILFDFIDVGPGKDRADDKVIESFKLYVDDYHCRQIFFGCSHDNGFARLLEEYMTDAAYVAKVTLLEGVPFEKELVALPYKTKTFPGLFRDTKISVLGAQDPSPAVKNYNVFNGLPTRFPPARTSSGNDSSALMDSPVLAKLARSLPRTPSSSTLASDGMPAAIKPAPCSWAAKAAGPPPPVTTSPTYRPASREEVIARNRLGQRVDPPCRDYDKAEVDRIKKIKMCNVHFLRLECPYDNNCTHLHNYEPTDNEIATLRLVARMAPCQNGSGCQDIKCIYGHRCPAPPAKPKMPKGSKSCIFGETCKFPENLHDVDCSVVKTLVIR